MAIGDCEVDVTSLNAFKGASFDGVDDYVQIPHHASQLGANLAGGFTISAWVYPRSAGENSSGRILIKTDVGTSPANGFQLTLGNKDLNMTIAAGATATYINFNLTYKNWKHALVTIDSAGSCVIYKDGTANVPANITAPSSIITTQNCFIGNRNGGTDRTFNGSIRSVKMWNRVLTTQEIAKDYAGINISDGQILNVPLQDDYDDIAQYKLTGTNSGTTLKIIDDAVYNNNLSGALSALGINTISGSFLMCDIANGQQILTSVLRNT